MIKKFIQCASLCAFLFHSGSSFANELGESGAKHSDSSLATCEKKEGDESHMSSMTALKGLMQNITDIKSMMSSMHGQDMSKVNLADVEKMVAEKGKIMIDFFKNYQVLMHDEKFKHLIGKVKEIHNEMNKQNGHFVDKLLDALKHEMKNHSH